MHDVESIVQRLNGVQRGAVIVAVVAAVLGVIGASADSDRFFRIYLVAYLFWVEIALGCLAFLMVGNLLNARWISSIQRVMAAGARTLPLMAVLFIPLLFGLGRVFPWVDAADKQTGYLNLPFFIVRAVIYFVVWIGLAYMLSNASYQLDGRSDEALVNRTRRLSIIGLIVYFITASLAAFDWSMSLNPDWFSSVYGWLSISRQALGTLALAIIVLAFFWWRKPLAAIIHERVIGDLGGLLLAALLGWVYLSFMQYFVIWSADLASKSSWFLPRTTGGWSGYVTFMVVLHAFTFALLILPGLKRIRWILLVIAALLLALRAIELFWVVMPTFQAEVTVAWWDFMLLLAFSGLWVAMLLWSLNSNKLLPAHHPDIQMMANQEEGNNETARSTP